MDTEGLEGRVALLTEVVGELLVWAQEAENMGAVEPGTLGRARLLLRVEALKRKAEALREALVSLESESLPTIKGNLQGALAQLEAEEMSLLERMREGA